MRFQVIKSIGGPGSLGFFLIVALLGFILFRFWPRFHRVGRLILILLPALYVALSLPVVAQGLAARLGGDLTLPTWNYRPVDQFFLLDGDNRSARAELAARLARVGQPQVVWILGWGQLRDAVMAHGLPRDKWDWGGVDADDHTTYGQIGLIPGLLERRGLKSGIVIVSRLQAPRVKMLLTRRGLDFPVVASVLDREPPSSGAWLWLPNRAALRLSQDAIYELVAVGYYRWKGWI